MSIILDGTLGITTPGETNTGTETVVNLTTSGNTILGDATTDTLNVGNGGLVKDASGNVGIGTASPTRLLDVSNAAGSANVAITSSTTGQSSVWFADTDTNVGGLYYEHTYNTMGFRTNDVEQMRIDSSGNVGIGTASPVNFGANTHSLTLDGTGLYNAVVWKSNGTIVANGYTNGTAGFILGTEGAIPLSLATNGTNQASITAAGLFQFNSGYGSVAAAYGCRAWVNFNGTGTVAIRASGNVSSITDNGTGDYTVNFTTAMVDANYAGNVTTGRNGGGSGLIPDAVNAAVPTTTTFRFYILATAFSPADSGYIFASFFR